jgi:hypothetical protein
LQYPKNKRLRTNSNITINFQILQISNLILFNFKSSLVNLVKSLNLSDNADNFLIAGVISTAILFEPEEDISNA